MDMVFILLMAVLFIGAVSIFVVVKFDKNMTAKEFIKLKIKKTDKRQ